VAEDSALAAGKDRGHPAALDRKASVADGIDATMDPVQAPALQATRNPRPTEAGLDQLLATCYAVLLRRREADCYVGPVDFRSHTERKSTAP
jgi:hypothetical protein